MYADKVLACRDCGTNFIFTAGEQEFYASKGFTNEPARCPSCRAANKRARGDGMGGGGGYAPRERQMYDVVCANCGAPTQVPFLPRGDRPVYCSDCFATMRGTTSGSYAGGGGGRRSSW